MATDEIFYPLIHIAPLTHSMSSIEQALRRMAGYNSLRVPPYSLRPNPPQTLPKAPKISPASSQEESQGDSGAEEDEEYSQEEEEQEQAVDSQGEPLSDESDGEEEQSPASPPAKIFTVSKARQQLKETEARLTVMEDRLPAIMKKLRKKLPLTAEEEAILDECDQSGDSANEDAEEIAAIDKAEEEAAKSFIAPSDSEDSQPPAKKSAPPPAIPVEISNQEMLRGSPEVKSADPKPAAPQQ
jgi:hypothetical protein